ncbi:macro domain-containing protein [Chitinophaga sp. Cy-1792]|uniref:macro domain-containing protein n=1 Tax=Chitinophaga sp. Cy-1792 TaxID=2608339 RepID=UPI001422CBCA|nr:macro domain-containing protein [Chitinophaga sp. Cy-1792]NIG53536.1 macro domain-containing protein [Chitinophaga sp. Cy-1792]
MIHYIPTGDIFQLPETKNYAHGCNCAGAMGKGIAVAFKEKFPEMYLSYKQLCKTGNFKPGDVFTYKYQDGYVFNVGTQKSWTTPATLDTVTQGLDKMMKEATTAGVDNIALPRIGAGLGKLDWEEVKRVINHIGDAYPHIDLYVVENYSLI